MTDLNNKELEVVINFLRNKGLYTIEDQLKQELLKKDSSSSPSSYSFNNFIFNKTIDNELPISNPTNLKYLTNEIPIHIDTYFQNYLKLKEWIYLSLDQFREELLNILFPIFVHSYLNIIQGEFIEEAKLFMEKFKSDHEELHLEEIQILESIKTPQQMQENEFSKILRTNRFTIPLSQFSYELLLNFLEDEKMVTLLKLINQYLNIRVYGSKPSPHNEYHAIIEFSEEDKIAINKKSHYWDLFFNQKPKLKQLTEEEKKGFINKKPKIEPSQDEVKSKIPLPKITEKMEQEYLEDLKQRISLNANHLPSICFYTIFNTYQSMNTLEISQDSSLVAGGFSNSSVRLWNIKKGTPLHEKHSTNDNQNSKLEDYNILVGHSGPVYSASFSPDNLFLLTGSEDHTVRLWCTQTCLNIACYKSHNYPVWDTIFSPLGCYFATASHDRTARFWCTERITPIRIFAGHLSDVNCVNFHPNCNYIATGSSDKSVRLWDVFSASPVRIFTGHFGSIDCLALSPDGKLIASAGDDNRIIVWDLATSKKLYTFIGHKKSIWSLDFSAESSLLASGSHDETICIWDISGQYKSENVLLEENNKQYSNELIKIFPTKQTPIFKVKFTRRNLLLAGGPYTPID